MIECVSENIYYKRRQKNRLKNKRFFGFIWVIVLFLGISLYYFYVIVPHVSEICAETFRSYSAEAVSKTALYSLDEEVRYENLVNVEKNADGDIVMLSVNSLKVNRINNELAVKTREKLSEYVEKGVKMPVMVFTGVKLLSGYGPSVRFKSVSVSDVKCDFENELKSVGINQTQHLLYAVVSCTVSVNMPLNNKVSVFSTRVLISDSVIVGEVPQTFLNGKLVV